MSFKEELEKRIGKKVKVGSKIKCINPEHEDKEPSMHVYENHAYCFGCGFVFPPNNKQKIAESFQFLLNEYAANVERFYKIQPFFYDKNKIFWIWNWDNYCYEICDELHLLSLIDEKLQFQGSTIRKAVKQEYLDAFKLIGRRRIPKDPDKNWIQFGGYVTNLKVGNNWGYDGREPSPEYFFTNPIPWDVGKTDKTPIIDKLFNDWVGPEYVQTLYEIIAYCCLTDYPIHLIFCMVGCGRNGKTQFQRLIQKFLGKNNISSTELDLLLDNRFESTKLYKKLVCVLGETNFGVMKKTSLLKKLSGGDLIGYEFKNKNPFDDVNYAKIIINSNALPSSLDTSDGFYRRWLIINFPNEFPEGKDIINTIPETEFSNLAKKVIKILPNVLKTGKLTNQGSIEERKQAYIMASNPFPYFVKNFCYRDDNIYIKSNELYTNYIKFLRLSKKRKVSRKEFNSLLSDEGLYSEKSTRGGVSSWFTDTINVKSNQEEIMTEMIEMTVVSPQPLYRDSNSNNSHNSHCSHSFTPKDIIFHIQRLGKGEMAIEELLDHFGQEAEKIIEKLLKDGELFQKTPGVVKIL